MTTNLFQWMQHLITELENTQQFKTAQSYRNCLRSFSLFLKTNPAVASRTSATDSHRTLRLSKGEALEISELTSDLIVNYQRFLLSKKVCLNTVSYYMRTLRAIYNKAVKSGITEHLELFSEVYTGIAKTEKRAVSADIIQRLKQLELMDLRGLAFARDLFLLSFYFRGMAFVDLANLKKTDVQNGVIRYTRSKTKQDLRIRIESCAMEILNRYTCKNSDRLLPVLSSFENSEKAYNSALRLQNKRLSKLSKMLNLSYSLSSYVARHSWATLAKKGGVDLAVISESLGHNSILTTQIYLDSLDQERIDDANFLVISMVG